MVIAAGPARRTAPTTSGRTQDVAHAVAAAHVAARRRALLVASGAAIVVLAASTAALVLGAAGVALPDLVAALAGRGDATTNLVVFRLRLPRVVAAVIAGVGLGLGGALFQSTLRNPLASPDILGVTGGASLAAVAAMLVLGVTGPAVSLAALAGALAVAAIIWALAWRDGLTGIRFVLVGIGVASIVSGLLGWLITRAEVREAPAALVWMVGGVSSIGWDELAVAGAALAVVVVLVALHAHRMPLLALDDDTARGLGVDVTRARLVAILLGVAAVAVATALTGPIAFVALVAAPVARALVGNGRAALAASALVGAAIVLVADLVAQHALGDVAVPVGIVTGLIGAPYLLWLIARGNRKGAGG
ncbi:MULTISPECIES: FecCD family ABC transporter permease [unclassified Agromyces]|uniref:FecCD family ABC transporter permease n=1 Tax=unclassified Agromyces TaxID=2639701 RepID=UPI0030155384